MGEGAFFLPKIGQTYVISIENSCFFFKENICCFSVLIFEYFNN